MTVLNRWPKVLAWITALLLAASAAPAQIEDQISAYTGDNAEGYLAPLADAIGADLNSSVWTSAHIPESDGLHLSFETRVVGVMFSDDQRTFSATTEAGFSPETTTDAPTVVGDGEAVIVEGDGGSSFAFPGGFDLHSFAIAVPQIRIGAYRGTEALVRYFAIDTGDVELGQLSLFGIGLHHSISQYMGPAMPVDLAAGFFYQKFTLGDDLMDATAFTVGVQASKRFPAGFSVIEPYAGLSVDMFSMDVSYQSEAARSGEITFEYQSDTSLDLTVGLNVSAAFFSLNGEYSISGQNTFAFGFGVGF